jgi:hypothetical protein
MKLFVQSFYLQDDELYYFKHWSRFMGCMISPDSRQRCNLVEFYVNPKHSLFACEFGKTVF